MFYKASRNIKYFLKMLERKDVMLENHKDEEHHPKIK